MFSLVQIQSACLFENHAGRKTFLSEIHSFLSIFLISNSFLPTNTHPPNTCSHFRYDLTTCSLPLISFRFHHSHQVRTFANAAKSIRRSIEDRSYLLARLFARHLLPSDPVSQGITNRQPQRPPLHELVMRFYITRN